MIWSSENSFKENILNIFEVPTLQSQYEEEKPEHYISSQNDLNCCCICYDQLDMAIKNQTKSCVNEKCDALYHMSCICEVLFDANYLILIGKNSEQNMIIFNDLYFSGC